MDQDQQISAVQIVNTFSERELTRILRDYSDERWAVHIARSIVRHRPIFTTMDLVSAIDSAVPATVRRGQQGHPARRTFQALRIEVNQELTTLEATLDTAMDKLRTSGRLVVITFHSLEDRIVKRTFRRMEKPCICPPDSPFCVCGRKPIARIITPKPVIPTPEELIANARAHSAKLRCVERVNGLE